jgi:carbamoylphosphate synthase large subunit
MLDELKGKGIRMVGQSPKLTERWDDKAATNMWLATQTGLEEAFPKSRIVHKHDMKDLKLEEDGIGWPRIIKPIRGRGSHGVAVVEDEKEFQDHIKTLFDESDAVLLEVCCPDTVNATILMISGILSRGRDHGNGDASGRIHWSGKTGKTLVTSSRWTYRSQER